MAGLTPFPLILGVIVLYCFARPALAFGAGNIATISSVEGQNCERSPSAHPSLSLTGELFTNKLLHLLL